MIQDTALSQSRPDRISKRLDRAAGPWAVPNKWFLIVLVVVALTLPWGIIQMSIGRFILHLLILFFTWGIVTQSWNLILGVGGIFSFAQVALFAVGGYTSGILSQQFGWSPFATIWLAPVAATIAALFIGLPVLRLQGAYVVLLTLAFLELLRNFGTQGPTWIAGDTCPSSGLRSCGDPPWAKWHTTTLACSSLGLPATSSGASSIRLSECPSVPCATRKPTPSAGGLTPFDSNCCCSPSAPSSLAWLVVTWSITTAPSHLPCSVSGYWSACWP